MRIVAAGLGVLLLLGGYLPSTNTYAPVAAVPKLADLKGFDELRSLFNNDVGKVRLVLLLSPT
jgi:hypothetical protein